jgi:hypothetical protein
MSEDLKFLETRLLDEDRNQLLKKRNELLDKLNFFREQFQTLWKLTF